jgi:hypothetical protein
MRRFRAGADAVSFGAQTLRDQPELIGAVDDIGGELGEALIRFRAEQGRPRVPLQLRLLRVWRHLADPARGLQER